MDYQMQGTTRSGRSRSTHSSAAAAMVVALGPGKFYGSSLPRPYIYTDVKHNDARVDPPRSVMDPLMTWAEEAHWSMGGLNVKRHRLQGRIEGNVNKLRAQREHEFKVSHKQQQKPVKSSIHKDKNSGGGVSNTPSPPPAPMSPILRPHVVAPFSLRQWDALFSRPQAVIRIPRACLRSLDSNTYLLCLACYVALLFEYILNNCKDNDMNHVIMELILHLPRVFELFQLYYNRVLDIILLYVRKETMVLWEAVLSPALQVLFDKLTSGDLLEFLRRNNLNDLLMVKLKIAYFTNAAMIADAEKKQYDNPAIEIWLDMLKDAVCEAEDVLDELATEALRCKLKTNSSLRNLVTNFSPFWEGVNSRIENLIEKLEYIAKHKDFLGLRSGENAGNGMMQRCPTTPLLIESQVYGRTFEKEEIMKLLIGDNEANSTIPSIIPILGMGGIGKTTLAQIIYNDKRVDEVFDVRAWAYVSDDFSLIRTTKALLESATGKPCDTMNLELLQSALKEIFNKKKFLVVLDDVWSEKLDNWNGLSIPFMFGSPGSRIIITTRNKEVLSVMDAIPLSSAGNV
ncbi:hypothetical protein BUALT_Bualt01G0160100 [Buddleja alternifolia]|uniref:Disease resistance RPP13-like protein 1 n=1 Tax=Buddleja alternifolia TaxID=168488 RepID=A0AAV6YG47_9LAMI|nr:hypothetical protein BUALT_Bualt01G0160100 [Buddleja alternifolia]